MKKFKFKDGQIIIASSVEEAKAKHKVIGAKEEDLIKILKELGFKGHSYYYARDMTKYSHELPSGKRKYKLSLGVEIESDKYSRIFLFSSQDDSTVGILSTFIKNDGSFRKNIQKFITKATNVSASFERWCEK